MALRAILFDKDGTLLDFEKTWGPATLQVLAELAQGDKIRHDALIEIAGIDPLTARFAKSSPIIAGSSADYGVPMAKVVGVQANADFFARLDHLFAVHGLDHITPIVGAIEAVQALAGHAVELGLVTNDSEAAARQQMERLGLAPRFTFLAGYDSGYGAKPHPGMIKAYLDQSGYHPWEVAVIGDSRHDLIAARAAGALAIAVTTGLASAVELQEDADLIAPHLTAALRALGF